MICRNMVGGTAARHVYDELKIKRNKQYEKN